MLTRFGQFNLPPALSGNASQAAARKPQAQFSGACGTGSQASSPDSFTLRFSGSPDAEGVAETSKMSALTGGSRMVVSQLAKTLHTVTQIEKKGNLEIPKLLWEVSLAEILLADSEVQQYLTSQGMSAEKMRWGLAKVFGELGDQAPADPMTLDASVPEKLAETFKDFARLEGKESVTPVTIWRWLMKSSDTRIINSKHHEMMLAAMAQNLVSDAEASQKGDMHVREVEMMNKLMAAPPSDSMNNSFPDWYVKNYRPILDQNDPRIAQAEALAPELLGRVYGQDAAIELISDSVFNGITGYPNAKKPHRPIARIMAMGPTGSGKTFTPEQLGEILGRKVITVPCNELHDATRLGILIGSGPGYAGKDSQTFVKDLMEANRAMMEDGAPPPVIIFDEIEKAAPKVQELLMTFLDTGLIGGSDRSEVGYGSGAIVFLTTNLGQSDMNELKEKGATKEEIADAAMSSLDRPWQDEEGKPKRFKPEFLARIDKRLVFNHIDKKDAERARDAKLESAYITPARNFDGCEMVIDPEVREFILSQGYNWKLGLRVLEDAVDQFFTPFNEERLRLVKSGQLKPGQGGGKMHVSLDNGELKLKYEPPGK